ncbi:MAG: hypothetical protein GX938_09815, partial [Spirochaetales bacterium]|nr:hypothetical protein [Spirochaetales bacterium]
IKGEFAVSFTVGKTEGTFYLNRFFQQYLSCSERPDGFWEQVCREIVDDILDSSQGELFTNDFEAVKNQIVPVIAGLQPKCFRLGRQRISPSHIGVGWLLYCTTKQRTHKPTKPIKVT